MRPDESFIAQPVRSLQTMLRVIAKEDKRIPLIVPDGIYGPSTMNTVAAFQRLYNIPETGRTDQITWDKIVEIYLESDIFINKATPIEILLEPNQTIQKGESNPYIYLLQGILMYLSDTNPLIPRPNMSGTLDGDTTAAILAFQKIASLEESGSLDRLTWHQIVNYFNLEVHTKSAITSHNF